MRVGLHQVVDSLLNVRLITAQDHREQLWIEFNEALACVRDHVTPHSEDI
jgi:hypothetical protein